MMHTIPHLVRSCNFPFVKRVLVIDTAPLSGDKINRPGIGTMAQLRDCCHQLIEQGIMDEVVDMDYSTSYRKKVYKKHFGTTRLSLTHNYKGYPILGSIFSIEDVPGDYVLHFDSDMLLYQEAGYRWIDEGMDLLDRRQDVMFVRPLSGPPLPIGNGLHQKKAYSFDEEGFYKFKFFSSRAFLLKRKKFESLLPIPVMWHGFKHKWLTQLPSSILTELNNFSGRGKLDSWEIMISEKLERTNAVRATLSNPRAWTLHPISRGSDFIDNLSEIIRHVEAGNTPDEQAGHYDVNMAAWIKMLEKNLQIG
jgi:hypothetical protein